MNFCAAILILKMEENMQHLVYYALLNFKKGNTTEMQKKDLCSVWRRCCDWSNVSKVVCKVSWYYWYCGQIILCCVAVLCIGRCWAAPLASTHKKPIVESSQHTQNIQINSYWWKWKVCLYFMGEKVAAFSVLWETMYENWCHEVAVPTFSLAQVSSHSRHHKAKAAQNIFP